MRSPCQALLLILSVGIGCQNGPAAADLGPGEDGAAREEDLAGADLGGGEGDLRPGGPGTLMPGERTITLTAGGAERRALLYVPAAAPGGPLPLAVALHGNGDTAGNFVQALGLRALAEAGPFILVAPQGIAQTLTIGGQTVRVSWDAYRGAGENIDLALLAALRRDLLATGSVDRRRVVLFGYSQGGYLSFRAGLETAQEHACAAVAAAANPLPGSRLIADAPRRVPVALQIGTLDGALGGARRAQAELMAAGHPLQYREIEGAGHVPFPGEPRPMLDYCLRQSL